MIVNDKGTVAILRARPLVMAGTSLAAVAGILHTVGLSSPYWVNGPHIYGGLWRFCFHMPGLSRCFSTFDTTYIQLQGWQRAVQGFVVLALFGATISTATCITYFIKRTFIRLLYVGALSAAASAAFSLLAVIIFGAKWNPDGYAYIGYPDLRLSWAYGLVCTAAILFLAVAGILGAEMRALRFR